MLYTKDINQIRFINISSRTQYGSISRKPNRIHGAQTNTKCFQLQSYRFYTCNYSYDPVSESEAVSVLSGSLLYQKVRIHKVHAQYLGQNHPYGALAGGGHTDQNDVHLYPR